MIEIKNINKSFGSNDVLKSVSFNFEAGKTNLIIGASGSGKTTLIKCMVGLHQQDSGSISFDGRDFIELDKKEKRRLRAYTINSKALGQVESGLDNIIIALSTCDRLIPLYERDFEINKTNTKWLKRAVSRMFNKECTDDPLFEKLAIAYAEASPSADAYSFVAGVLAKKGDSSGAEQMRMKAFDLETDPFKKANFKLKFAQSAKKRGQKSKARQLAREAISLNPNMGRAYLFIASLYATSVNSCGTNEFEKRMTYVAAHNKAVRASRVDPSMSSVARKFIRNYKANFPSKKVIFTEGVKEGDTFKVKCWINESVKITSSGR